MIKPTYLWALCKTCEDSKWIGDICRSLGGQEVKLDFGQKQVADMIKMDSEWMDERINWNREAARMRQARARERRAEELAAARGGKAKGETKGVAQASRKKGESVTSREVTPPSRHPSVHPSIHPSIGNNMEMEVDITSGAVAPPPPSSEVVNAGETDPLVVAEAERVAKPTEAQVVSAAMLMGIDQETAKGWLDYIRQMDWRFTSGAEVTLRNFRTSLRRFAAKAQEEARKAGIAPAAAPKEWTAMDWALCLERCRNCQGVGCGAGIATPPDKESNPRPPEECPAFDARFIP